MSKIDVDKLDAGFKYEIASHPGAENIRRCFSCGTPRILSRKNQVDRAFPVEDDNRRAHRTGLE